MKNIAYTTSEIERYFSRNRIAWNQFYESETEVIEAIWPDYQPRVLDIGCGCGGLGMALYERFGAKDYTGIEINEEAASTARMLNPNAKILCMDFLQMKTELFDLVFSLSCIDWNINFDEMLRKAWEMVKPGGVFIGSFRLTLEEGIDDINRSYQYINYEGRLNGEIAPYVVLNVTDLVGKLQGMLVGRVYGYGYIRPPSKTAVTPYKELCFASLAVIKAEVSAEMEIDLKLPLPFVTLMKSLWQKSV